MKHNLNATANATAVTVATLYVICRVLVLVMPDLFLTVAGTWFHGIDISKIAATGGAGDFNSFILGLITIGLGGWLMGYLFAITYNYFAKK